MMQIVGLFLLLFALNTGHAGYPDEVESRFILTFENERQARYFQQNRLALHSPARLKPIFGPLHVWLYQNNGKEKDLSTQLKAFRDAGLLKSFHPDRPLEDRSTFPDDPLYSEQWNLEAIQMPDAWDVTTGGLTATGNRIVVAVIDSGFDPDHPDISENIWVNADEIPNDQVDNDNNGYVDDYLGLNVDTGDDNHMKRTHGTSVTGIIGATGNNGEGVSGINWDVDLMLISGTSFESEVIESYQYILRQKQEYLESDGERGAFIVASNLSAGIDNAFPEDHPVWCAIYDMLGNAGILNACATTNRNANVDDVGDMPTTCPSQYLIAVTNTDINDAKVSNAGYGEIHIDLAAPGTNSLTTDINNAYHDFPGTSASTPHVTGAIALLYSVPCLPFAEAALAQPAQTALLVREAILTNVDLLDDLTGQVNSGGRLNVFKSMQLLNIYCGGTYGDLELLTITPNPARESIEVTFDVPDDAAYVARIYNAAGQLTGEVELDYLSFGPRKFEVPLDGYVPGVYYITLRSGGTISTKAFVVY